MNVAVVGSSPLMLVASALLSEQGYEVHVFEKRRMLGGAWRHIYDPYLGTIPAYNNILLAANLLENNSFDRICQLLNMAGISYYDPHYRVTVNPLFRFFRYASISLEDIKPKLNKLYLGSRSVQFYRFCPHKLIVRSGKIDIGFGKSFEKILFSCRVPFDLIDIDGWEWAPTISYTKSIHLHCLVSRLPSDENLYTSYSEPFNALFDRGSFLPHKENLFANRLCLRVARGFKRFSTSGLLNHHVLRDRLKDREILYTKKRCYLSRNLDDISALSCLSSILESSSDVLMLETGQLSGSILQLEGLMSKLF